MVIDLLSFTFGEGRNDKLDGLRSTPLVLLRGVEAESYVIGGPGAIGIAKDGLE
jgi:hypothetical protein